MATDLRILTVRQPWAGAILHFGKDVENRTQRTGYIGPLVIHSGLHIDQDRSVGALRDAMARFASDQSVRIALGDTSAYQSMHTRIRGASSLLDLVDLVECIPYEQCGSPWRMAPPDGKRGWCWKLANPRPFAEPIPAKGKLGLWRPDRLDTKTHALLDRELERVGVDIR